MGPGLSMQKYFFGIFVVSLMVINRLKQEWFGSVVVLYGFGSGPKLFLNSNKKTHLFTTAECLIVKKNSGLERTVT